MAIKEYFKGKNVLITGGSGFVGKVLIEKLLRSCPDLGKVFLILRPKRGKNLEERLEEIKRFQLFDLLRNENPERLAKIIALSGDTTKDSLGLSNEDKLLLIEKVHIFFNAAASVRFNDSLREAIMSNIKSTQEAAFLAMEMKQLEVFTHISTTYCNIDEGEVVDEKLYPAPVDWKETIRVAKSCDPLMMDVLAQKYIGCFPNTYTFTKRMAEHSVNELLVGKVNCIICRPSIIIASVREPYQGWIDNVNGPTGLLLSGGTGLMRIFFAKSQLELDFVFVDNLVKILIAAAWQKTITNDKEKLTIYHASKSQLYTFASLSDLHRWGDVIVWEVPFKRKIWFPGSRITNCFYYFYMNVLFFHVLPAILLDLGIRLVGHKAMILKIQRKIYIANKAIHVFLSNVWEFRNPNVISLFSAIPKDDLEEFNFRIHTDSDEELHQYFKNSCDVARQVILKEDKEISNDARRSTLRMYYIDRFFKLIFGILIWLLIHRTNVLDIFN